MSSTKRNSPFLYRTWVGTLCWMLAMTIHAGCGGSSGGDGSGTGGDPIAYAALGASDVVGVGATPLTNGYVYLLRDSLENETGKSFDLENLGVPGAQINQIKNIEVEILKRSAQPDLVTVSTGANDLVAGDTARSFESGLGDVLSELRGISPSAIIAISNLPDLTKLPRFQEKPDRDVTESRVRAFNAAIARQAARYNAVLVDLYSVPLQDSFVNEIDGFHPSDAGHRAIANAFLSALMPYISSLSE
jgi:acyl-CoA thioesterase-1